METMNLNFDIPKDHGKTLDALAAKGHRSRRAQARKLLMESLELESGRSVSHNEQPKQMEAGQ